MSKSFFCGVILAIMPAVASSQVPGNPVYRRAQTMVNDGNAVAGRALVDSMVAVASPGSNDYAEAIYWRAVLAATTLEAEMDYRRLIVDFPLSPRVEDALIRLAQLDIARANYDSALRHLNRIAAEHPGSPATGRAGYWTARALFDKNELQGGCAATANALAVIGENDAELRNQINYLNQRCVGVVIGPAVAAPPAATADATVGGATNPVVNLPAPAPIRDTTRVVVIPVAPSAAAPVDSVRTSVATPPVKQSTTPKPRPVPPSKPLDTGPTMVETPSTIPAASTARERTKAFSVQTAAYNQKSQADAMVARLKKNGYEARVDGTVAPFRVRIGRYATQSQASAVQRSLKAKQIEGFVVQADIK